MTFHDAHFIGNESHKNRLNLTLARVDSIWQEREKREAVIEFQCFRLLPTQCLPSLYCWKTRAEGAFAPVANGGRVQEGCAAALLGSKVPTELDR
jgi:hypothetical protein